jgi:hypothetical protein
MNNVYLTFGKKAPKDLKNARGHTNITPSLLKNKNELQNLYFNQSFSPKKDFIITQSIDFEHFKAILDMKASQRMKTSPDKYPSF